jgi:hypothetical protein
VEFELPGDEAIMHRDGDRLVVEPVRKRGLVALLKTMKLPAGYSAPVRYDARKRGSRSRRYSNQFSSHSK